MKRLVVLLVVLLPVSWSIAGCGGPGGKTGPKSGEQTKEIADYAKNMPTGKAKAPESSAPK
jgi:hypothetical protein